jgi:ubiquitin C-terminal hydrolase
VIEEDSFVANDRTMAAQNINVDAPSNDHYAQNEKTFDFSKFSPKNGVEKSVKPINFEKSLDC